MVLILVFNGKVIKLFLVMMGEIILCGKVLLVGGIKEKILVVKCVGMKDIILCKENEKYVFEIQSNYIEGMNFYYVEQMSQVLKIVFG